LKDWDVEVVRWSLALIIGFGAFAITRPESAEGGGFPTPELASSREAATVPSDRGPALFRPPSGTLALSSGSLYPGHCVIRFSLSRLDPELQEVSLFGVTSNSLNPAFGWLPLHRVEAQTTVRRGRAWGADHIGLSPDRFDEGFILFPFDADPDAIVEGFAEGRYFRIMNASGEKGSDLLEVVDRCAAWP